MEKTSSVRGQKKVGRQYRQKKQNSTLVDIQVFQEGWSLEYKRVENGDREWQEIKLKSKAGGKPGTIGFHLFCFILSIPKGLDIILRMLESIKQGWDIIKFVDLLFWLQYGE